MIVAIRFYKNIQFNSTIHGRKIYRKMLRFFIFQLIYYQIKLRIVCLRYYILNDQTNGKIDYLFYEWKNQNFLKSNALAAKL